SWGLWPWRRYFVEKVAWLTVALIGCTSDTNVATSATLVPGRIVCVEDCGFAIALGDPSPNLRLQPVNRQPGAAVAATEPLPPSNRTGAQFTEEALPSAAQSATE